MTLPTPTPAPPQTGVTVWNLLAAVVCLAAVAGSLYLSLGLGLKACPLCFYQRAFAMAALGVLWIGVLNGVALGARPGLYGALALPAVCAGLAIAVFHVYLESNGILECPHGVFGVGSAPQQSLAAFAALAVLLLLDVLAGGISLTVPLMGLALGVVLGLGGIASVPKRSTPEYDRPVDEDMCRPPQPAR